MIKLDDNLLVELGLSTLPKEEKSTFLKHMYETLEIRVGTRLAEKMSDAQMSEFEQFINSNDEQGAFHWLEANFPNYKDVVAEEFDKLKNEIKPIAPQIVASSQQHAQQAGQPQPAVDQSQAVPQATVQAAPQVAPQTAQPQQLHYQPSQPPAAPQADHPQPTYAQQPQPMNHDAPQQAPAQYQPQQQPSQAPLAAQPAYAQPSDVHAQTQSQPQAQQPQQPYGQPQAQPQPQYPQPVQPPAYNPPQAHEQPHMPPNN